MAENMYDRVYNCSGCGGRHAKPTGKRCRQNTSKEEEFIKKSDMVDFMAEIRGIMTLNNNRMAVLEQSTRLQNAEHVLEDVGQLSVNEDTADKVYQTRDSANNLQTVDKNKSVHNKGLEERQASEHVGQLSDKEDTARDSANNLQTVDKNKSVHNKGLEERQASEHSELSLLTKEIKTLIDEVKGSKSNALASIVGGDKGALASSANGYSTLASVRGGYKGALASFADTRIVTEDMVANTSLRDDSATSRVEHQMNNNAAGINNKTLHPDLSGVDNDILKQNTYVMRQAANRLAELGIQEICDEDLTPQNSGTSSKGRKSGAVSVLTDKVKVVTDWPHYHVSRGVNLVPCSFDELSQDEFMLGYTRMVLDEKSTFDVHNSMVLLGDLCEDIVDFSWINVKAFYKSVALEVEYGKLKWSDTEAIQKRRNKAYRAVKVNVKPVAEPKYVKQMPNGGVCCALFQTNACDKKFDHGNFVHACAFCWKNKNMLYKHNETQCFSKAKEPKN